MGKRERKQEKELRAMQEQLSKDQSEGGSFCTWMCLIFTVYSHTFLANTTNSIVHVKLPIVYYPCSVYLESMHH